MVTQITHGIKVSVETEFRDDFSSGNETEFLFDYHITIENTGEHTVQLLRRHWYIFDSMSNWSEVEGEGVVGQKPLLEPGESYRYGSSCLLKSDIGTMHGVYLFERKLDGKLFEVEIPRFELMTPARFN